MIYKYFRTYIVVLAVFILLVSGCVSGPKNNISTTSVKNTTTTSDKNITSSSNATVASTPTLASTATVASTPILASAATLSSNTTVKCELCHKNSQDLAPHVKGGKYCISCHGSQVHSIHIGAGTVNLDCNACHGFPPTIPAVQKGEGPGHYIVCENCHAAPPDNLKPSNGNLIVIHLSRSKYCTNCHGTDIGGIHAAVLANASNRTR
jgi:hypothetical protein